MTCKSVMRHVVLLTLVVSLCSLGLWADSTSDPCPSTTQCTATCNSSPCQVQVTRSGGSLSLMYNNTDASVLCAADDSTVTWATSTATPSLIGAFFSASHYPGSTNVVTGSNAVAASSTVTAPSQDKSCYVYQIVVCDATGSCGVLDPKVVVTGLHVGGKHKKKEKQ
ncbi:MAG: hypothetical protein WBW69_23200 [Candidatus Korobacteraceae bacterium]